jgi:hypothetical protein
MTTREVFWQLSMMRHRVEPSNTNEHFLLNSEVVVRFLLARTTTATRCWYIWHQMMEQNIISRRSRLAKRHRTMTYFPLRVVQRK